ARRVRARSIDAARAETEARSSARAREAAEDLLPPLREEEVIASAILQRLTLQQAQLADLESRARSTIDTLRARITELSRDADRETGLNRDAGETIARLEWEVDQLQRAHEGHEAQLAQSLDLARAASAHLSDVEAQLSDATEDAARLAARHQSAQRMLGDGRARVEKAEADAARARAAEQAADAAQSAASAAFASAEAAQSAAAALVLQAEAALLATEAARSTAQNAEALARGEKSQAEGEASALRAEVAALAKLVERDSGHGTQLLDHLTVAAGYELALGAALGDDLRSPQIGADGATGWAILPDLATAPPLPAGARPLAAHVAAPPVLARRLGQIGLVDAGMGAALQPSLVAGQRLVSLEGDLFRWDGLRTAARDAPSAAAQRLIQRNRLAQTRADLAQVEDRLATAAAQHSALQTRLADLARADGLARDARRAADTRVTDAARAAARAEADKSIAIGKLEAAQLALSRHMEDAAEARAVMNEASAAMADLPDLATSRGQVDSAKIAVEAARITMMSRRSAHDELRREGEARVRRRQDAAKELAGWKQRLETAARRMAELAARRDEAEQELAA
ncbi:MAG: chromosome segregation protein SMC, partial [Cypionkella sp.]